LGGIATSGKRERECEKKKKSCAKTGWNRFGNGRSVVGNEYRKIN